MTALLSARRHDDLGESMPELRTRLRSTEEQLMFIREVFGEFRSSASELEAELSTRNKQLEAENRNLARELQQVRDHISKEQASSTQQGDDFDPGYNEELLARERRALNQLTLLEQENNILRGLAGLSANQKVETAPTDMYTLKTLKNMVSEIQVATGKLHRLTESRFSAKPTKLEMADRPEPNATELQVLLHDIQHINTRINKILGLLQTTTVSRLFVHGVGTLLADEEGGAEPSDDVNGFSDLGIMTSCFVFVRKVLIAGEKVPQFKRLISPLKVSLEKEMRSTSLQASHLANSILLVCHDVIKYFSQTPVLDVPPVSRQSSIISSAVDDSDEVLARMTKEIEKVRAKAQQEIDQARQTALEQAMVDRRKIEDEVYSTMAQEMEELKAALQRAEKQNQQVTQQHSTFQSTIMSVVQQQSTHMLQAMARAKEEVATLRQVTRTELAETQKELNASLNHIRKVTRTIAKSDISQLSMMYERELDQRIKLQDQVQALRGNIRVFCRIRPLLGREIDIGEIEAVTQEDEMTLKAEDEEGSANAMRFNFDRVFGPGEPQEIVFEELRTLCLSAMDGYNVCIFAYGITGSGKTFTVEGGEGARDDPKQHGLVYRTIKEIFRIAHGERSGAYDTEIGMSMLELYNEDFRDLLVPVGERVPRPEVRIIPDVGVQVDNVRTVFVKKMTEAIGIIKQGYENRTTHATESNLLSSRSHSILTLHLKGVNLRTKQEFMGKLHFVDLAGSERVSKSGVSGQRLKEAQAINKSLSALGDVISALSTKEKFVPYRNSNLTKLLQESLSGNSKTVMIANISPCKHSLSETLNSLRFATRTHKVEMGKAAQNMSSDPKEIKELKDKLLRLEAKLKARDPQAAHQVQQDAQNNTRSETWKQQFVDAPAPATESRRKISKLQSFKK